MAEQSGFGEMDTRLAPAWPHKSQVPAAVWRFRSDSIGELHERSSEFANILNTNQAALSKPLTA
jgi:hypothetical protein